MRTTSRIQRSTIDHCAEVEVEHLVKRGRVPLQAAPQGSPLPAIDQQVGHLPHIGICGDLAKLPRFFQATSHSLGNCGKASFDLLSKHLADTRQLLAEATKKATHVAIYLI